LDLGEGCFEVLDRAQQRIVVQFSHGAHEDADTLVRPQPSIRMRPRTKN
jgi:hypothetical protein